MPQWDVLKFLAIFLVVFGHVKGALHYAFPCPYFDNFVDGMNMPLFFMISGYFAAKTIESGNWSKLIRHLRSYFWPLAVLSCFFSGGAILLQAKGCEHGFVGYAGRWFLFGSWFVWCLSICYCLTFLCRRVGAGWKFVLALAGLYLGLTSLRHVWHLHNVRSMWPFFIIGVCVLSRWEVWKKWVGQICFVLYLCGVILQGNIHSNGLSFYGADTTLIGYMNDISGLGKFLCRIMNGFCGGVGLMWFVWTLFGYVKSFEKASILGTTTLGIYLLHQWILERLPLEGFSGFLPCVLVAVMLFGVCHVFTWYLKKKDFLRKWLWGDF